MTKMKHIFHVHSHITFFVSKQYVFDKEINPDDCLFLFSRDYIPSSEYLKTFRYIINYPQDVLSFNNKKTSFPKKIYERFHKIHVIEDLIFSFCNNDNFIFYTYSTYSHLCCIMATMRTCIGYYIIEEGASAYIDNSIIKQLISRKNLLFQSLLVPFFPRFYLLKDHHFSTSSKKYRGTIATSEKAFTDMSGKHIVVSNPFNKKKLPYPPTAIISIDASLYFCNIELDYVTKIMEDIYHFILQKQQNPIIAYKIHPILVKENVEKSFRDILIATFEDIKVIELSSDTSIEEVLNEYHCDFFSDWSAVAIYAAQMGCTCYSYGQKLSQICHNKKYEAMIKNNNMNKFLRDAYIQIP